jgi:hypothetical protein
MRNSILALLLAALAGNASAGEWTYIDHDDDSALWVQTDSIWRSDGNVKMWHMYDFRVPFPSLNSPPLPTTVRSAVALSEYDCTDRRVRPLQGTSYEDARGTGRVAWTMNKPGAWAYVQPGGPDEKRWNIACKKR